MQEQKKALQEEEERDQALQAKASLTIPLLPETEHDRKLAGLLKFQTLDCECRGVLAGREGRVAPRCLDAPPPHPATPSSTAYEDKQKLKRSEINSRSWFAPAAATGPGPGPSPGCSSKANSVLKKLAHSRRPAPAGPTITAQDLGIVRLPRASREDSGDSPPSAAETPKAAKPQEPASAPQDYSQQHVETKEPKARAPRGQEGSCRKPAPAPTPALAPCPALPPPGAPRETADPTPPPQSLGSSLVADYSDSSESE